MKKLITTCFLLVILCFSLDILCSPMKAACTEEEINLEEAPTKSNLHTQTVLNPSGYECSPFGTGSYCGCLEKITYPDNPEKPSGKPFLNTTLSKDNCVDTMDILTPARTINLYSVSYSVYRERTPYFRILIDPIPVGCAPNGPGKYCGCYANRKWFNPIEITELSCKYTKEGISFGTPYYGTIREPIEAPPPCAPNGPGQYCGCYDKGRWFNPTDITEYGCLYTSTGRSTRTPYYQTMGTRSSDKPAFIPIIPPINPVISDTDTPYEPQ